MAEQTKTPWCKSRVTIPFTTEAFYGVFKAYNTAVWPIQLLLLALGVLAVALLIRQPSYASVGISTILTVLWAWQALAYHLVFFAAINPLAYIFAALFIAGAVTFFWQGVVYNNLNFKITTGWRMGAGWGLMFFALFFYPAWTYLAGHRYPAFPTFGLPCPTTLFSIGLLAFLSKPYPRSVFVTPILWCFVGSQAAFVFDIQADLGLIVAGVFGLVLAVQSKLIFNTIQKNDNYKN
jgi:Family of unknown function (DUF6064)